MKKDIIIFMLKWKSLIKAKYYGIIRGVTVGIAFLLQIAIMVLLAMYLIKGAVIAYFVLEILSVLTVYTLVNNAESYKMGWIIIILVLPLAGLFMYYQWGRRRTNTPYFKNFRKLEKHMHEALIQDNNLVSELEKKHPNKVQISRYLRKEGFPIYNNTQVEYFDVGEKAIDSMMEDIKNAQKFIFMEYFIVNEGKVWDDLLEILTQKAKEGVEIKLLFDDFGTLYINDKYFREDLRARGIELCIFNPIHHDIARLSCNYRDHRKITVVDGNIAYTGGFNLADEYANYTSPFGHWKDTSVRLYGEGVYSFTCFFLEMWQLSKKKETPFEDKYKPTANVKEDGYVQPFIGGPHRNPNNPVEGAYTRMINKARDYIYITTPYLVLDLKMIEDLTSAAESGVDVRIIVPAVYDKWYVYMVNVSNYGKLMKAGVRIFEYQPGFIHAKNVISDDECAICGTINTDYRSFYLHYECGLFMNDIKAVLDMKEDFLDTQSKCKEMDLATWYKRPVKDIIAQSFLRILSPLL